MEDGSINKVYRWITGNSDVPAEDPSYKVEPTEPTEKQGVDDSTENPNETPKNIHPYLGHNLDIKA